MSSSEILPYNVLYAGMVSLTATTFVSGISWGIMTAFYSICMYSLILRLRSANGHTRKTVMLATWITFLWVFSTLSTMANAICALYAFVWKMDYPGGPTAYLDGQWNEPLPVLTVATYILTMWLADAMMLWRLVVIYRGTHRLIRGIIYSVVSLIYIGVLGTGSAMLAIISFNQTLYSTYALRVSIPCFSLSVALNVLATTLISARLIVFKRTMEKTLGRKQAEQSPYTSIAAMLIESAALYATWSLVFIVVYVLNNPGQYVMIVTLCHVQVISPVMIVYRVSKGLGWEQTTSVKLTTITQLAFAEHHVHVQVESDIASGGSIKEQEDKASDALVFSLPTESSVRVEMV